MKKCNKDCNKCKSLNIRTDSNGYPFGYECIKYDVILDMSNLTGTKEFL